MKKIIFIIIGFVFIFTLLLNFGGGNSYVTLDNEKVSIKEEAEEQTNKTIEDSKEEEQSNQLKDAYVATQEEELYVSHSSGGYTVKSKHPIQLAPYKKEVDTLSIEMLDIRMEITKFFKKTPLLQAKEHSLHRFLEDFHFQSQVPGDYESPFLKNSEYIITTPDTTLIATYWDGYLFEVVINKNIPFIQEHAAIFEGISFEIFKK